MALRAGEVIRESFRVVFANFGAFLRTQGALLLAVALLTLLLQVPEPPTMRLPSFNGTNATQDPAAFQRPGPGLSGFSGLVGLLSFLVGIAASGIGMHVARAIADGEAPPTLKDAWARAKPRYGNLLGTTLLVALALIGIVLAASIVIVPVFLVAVFSGADPGTILILGTLLAMVALGFALWIAARWAIAIPMSAFETMGATDNMRRSRDLTRGSRRSIIGVYLVVGLIALGPALVAAGVAIAHTLGGLAQGVITPMPFSQRMLLGVLSGVGSVVGGALFAAAHVTMYRKLAPPPAPELPPY